MGNVGSEDVLKAAEDYTGINVDFNWVANDSYSDILGVTLMDQSEYAHGNHLQEATWGANIVQAAKDGAFWDLNDFVWDEEKYPTFPR